MPSFFPRHLLRTTAAWSAVLAAAVVLAPSAWAAPYVWVTSDRAGALAHVGELIPSRKASPAPALSDPRAMLTDGKALALRPAGDGYAIAMPSSTPTSDVRFTARSLASNGVLTIYEARAGRSDTKPVNDLELVPTEPNGTTFRLYWKGNPVTATEVNVQTSAGWRRALYAAPDGTVSLVSPDFPALFPSRYVLDVTVKVNGKVTLDGKTYDQVQHTATLTFDVPAR